MGLAIPKPTPTRDRIAYKKTRVTEDRRPSKAEARRRAREEELKADEEYFRSGTRYPGQ